MRQGDRSLVNLDTILLAYPLVIGTVAVMALVASEIGFKKVKTFIREMK